MESYLKDNEKLISRLTLHNNLLAIFKLDCLESISNRQPFPFIQRLCSQDVSMSSLSTSQDLLTALLRCITTVFYTVYYEHKPANIHNLKRNALNSPKMETLLRNSSYIFLFLRVLP